MSLKLVNQGKRDSLAAFLNVEAAEDLILRLFKNNQIPADADTEADYTEATFIGYAPVTLDALDWTITEANPAVATQPPQEFRSTQGGQDQGIYGYYVVGADSGRLKWAERFSDGVKTIINFDDVLRVTPRYTQRSEV